MTEICRWDRADVGMRNEAWNKKTIFTFHVEFALDF